MKKYWQEFREFAVKGNVIDLAVAVIVGGAFGKIVSSLVADIVMPLVGVLLGGINFTSWKWTIKEAIMAADGSIEKAAVTMNIGNFIQNIFDFLVIAVAIFMMVKMLTKVKNRLAKEEAAEKTEEAPKISDEVKLLTEIRDELKNRRV